MSDQARREKILETLRDYGPVKFSGLMKLLTCEHCGVFDDRYRKEFQNMLMDNVLLHDGDFRILIRNNK